MLTNLIKCLVIKEQEDADCAIAYVRQAVETAILAKTPIRVEIRQEVPDIQKASEQLSFLAADAALEHHVGDHDE